MTRKPMARAVRIALFEREVRERLSLAALDLLFARVAIISEGQRQSRAGRDAYCGSTMLTFDLADLTGVLRDACDAGTAKQLADVLASDANFPRRLRSIAEREAARIAEAPLADLNVETTIRAQGAKVFVDVDVEATCRR